MSTRSIAPLLAMLVVVNCASRPAAMYMPSPTGYAPGGPAIGMQPGGYASQSVTRQTWCSSLGQSYCRHCAGRDAAVCLDQFVPACMANHPPNETLAGMTALDTQWCGTALESADCGAVAAGRLPWVCRQPQPVMPNQYVTLQTWCGSLGRSYCRRCMAAEMAECMDHFVPSCIAGRDPNLVTDRSGAELMQCGSAIDQAACPYITPTSLPPPCLPHVH